MGDETRPGAGIPAVDDLDLTSPERIAEYIAGVLDLETGPDGERHQLLIYEVPDGVDPDGAEPTEGIDFRDEVDELATVLGELIAQRDDARAVATGFWAENIVLTGAVTNELVLKKALKARLETRGETPDPWAQVAELRAELQAFVAGHPNTLAANTISAVLARTDPEHQHFGDNGVCFECGAATDPAAGQ